MADIIEEIGKIMTEWAQEMGDEMRASLISHDHVDAAHGGNLYQAVGVNPEDVVNQEGTWMIRYKLDLPFYYYFLNKGRKPTRNPGDGALRRKLQGASGWISKKGIDVKQKTGLKNAITANKSLAFWWAKKIHEKGYPPSYWFDQVWGGDPVPENSKAVKKLQERLAKLLGNERFIVELIKPD